MSSYRNLTYGLLRSLQTIFNSVKHNADNKDMKTDRQILHRINMCMEYLTQGCIGEKISSNESKDSCTCKVAGTCKHYRDRTISAMYSGPDFVNDCGCDMYMEVHDEK